MGRPKEFDPERAVADAMDVFWRQGYGATTPQQLADGLRIGKGSLYNAFGGKRQLFDLALRRYIDLRVEGLRSWAEAPGPAKDLLREALLFLVRSDSGGPDPTGCLATNTAVELGLLDEVVTAQIRGLFDRAEDVFASLVARGQREGDIRADLDAAALASMLLTVTTGLHVQARLGDAEGRIARAVDATLAML